jgi:hypothetical protein
MSNINGNGNRKLSIHVDRDPLPDMVQVRVNFNERSFEIHGYEGQHYVLDSVISAAIRSCLDIVPRVEEKLPF